MKKTIAVISVVACLVGCARFGTVQKDIRYENGKIAGEITTRASAYTLFSAKSDLARWKATQSEKSEGAEVGGLSQQGGTNAVAFMEQVARAAEALNGK